MLQVPPAPLTTSAGADRVLVAVPAYNEDRFIGSVVLKLIALGYAVLVVDDGSTDATAGVAERAGARVVRHRQNRGKAAAVRTAFQYARGQGVDHLVLMDGDSQHDPAEVATLLQPLREHAADMVVGSRFLGARSAIPLWRKAGQHALTLATNVGSGERLTDSQSGFRAFTAAAIERMRFGRPGFAVESEMQFQAHAHGMRVVEVPIRVHYDLAVKRNPVRQAMNVLDGVLHLVAQSRPLLFFSLPGLLLFMAGLLLGWQVVRIYEETVKLAVGYAMITVMLCVLGTLALVMGILLHTMRALFVEYYQRGEGEPTR
jgi:glycosyltransferase involved in cell wall biosynthesis